MLLRKLRFTCKTLTVLIFGVHKPRYTSIKIVIFEKILKNLEKINNSTTVTLDFMIYTLKNEKRKHESIIHTLLISLN